MGSRDIRHRFGREAEDGAVLWIEAKGGKLIAPQAQAFLYTGAEAGGATYPVADTTKVGTDFAFKK